MKQRITPEQLAELSEKQKERLREWWKPQEYDITYIENYYEKGDHHTGICFIDEVQEYEPEKYYCYIEVRHTGAYFGCGKMVMTPVLSIGQMVEFLQSTNTDWTISGSAWDEPDICDYLWSIVKKHL